MDEILDDSKQDLAQYLSQKEEEMVRCLCPEPLPDSVYKLQCSNPLPEISSPPF